VSSNTARDIGTGLGVLLLAIVGCVILFFWAKGLPGHSQSKRRAPHYAAPRATPPPPYVVPPLPGPLPVASRYRSLLEVAHG
jgi:hypothetical protein